MANILEKYNDYLLKERKYSLHTAVAYQKDILSFQAFCKEEDKEMGWQKVEYDVVRLWVMRLSEKEIANKTINRKISALKSFFKFLYTVGEIDTYPLSGHKSLRNEKRVQVPFSENEMQVVHQYDFGNNFEGLRNQLIIELFYTLGVRRTELISLKVSDIDFGAKTIKILGKRKKERLLPMVEEVMALLKRYIEVRNKTFVNVKDVLILLNNGNILNETFVYRLINNYFRGITPKEKKSPHMLRHTFATHLLNNGADLNSIKELMGHASLSSTQIYTHSSLTELKKTYQQAHPRIRKKD